MTRRKKKPVPGAIKQIVPLVLVCIGLAIVILFFNVQGVFGETSINCYDFANLGIFEKQGETNYSNNCDSKPIINHKAPLTSYGLTLSDSCIDTKCFDICELAIFDNSSAKFSGELNYNDDCSRDPIKKFYPLYLSHELYKNSKVIEINPHEQPQKGQVSIIIEPNLNILNWARGENGNIIKSYEQVTIDQTCSIAHVTNNYEIIVETLFYIVGNCQNLKHHQEIGSYEFKAPITQTKNHNQEIIKLEPKAPVTEIKPVVPEIKPVVPEIKQSIPEIIKQKFKAPVTEIRSHEPLSISSKINYCMQGLDRDYDITECYLINQEPKNNQEIIKLEPKAPVTEIKPVIPEIKQSIQEIINSGFKDHVAETNPIIPEIIKIAPITEIKPVIPEIKQSIPEIIKQKFKAPVTEIRSHEPLSISSKINYCMQGLDRDYDITECYLIDQNNSE